MAAIDHVASAVDLEKVFQACLVEKRTRTLYAFNTPIKMSGSVSLNTGDRVPIVTGGSGNPDGQQRGRSYQYQDIGCQINASVQPYPASEPGEWVAIDLQFSLSHVIMVPTEGESVSGALPIIASLRKSHGLVTPLGKDVFLCTFRQSPGTLKDYPPMLIVVRLRCEKM